MLTEYLNMYPDGEVMKKFRDRKKRVYPFNMDSWSEDTSLNYLITNRDFILEALKNPSEKDNKIWIEKINHLILDEIFLYIKRQHPIGVGI